MQYAIGALRQVGGRVTVEVDDPPPAGSGVEVVGRVHGRLELVNAGSAISARGRLKASAALECVRCHNCESGRGCARGIATTDPELMELIEFDWGTQRIINMFLAWRSELVRILKRLGMKSLKELVGRTDCLVHLDYQ